MNMLSGTSGLAGIVDTVFILDREKRTENNATLLCMGRDVESAELNLAFDSDTRTWQCLGAAEEVPLMDEVIAAVADYLFSTDDFSGTATELSAEIEKGTGRTVSPATLKKKLMKHHGELLEQGWRFSSRRTRNEKIIEIRRRPVDAPSFLNRTRENAFTMRTRPARPVKTRISPYTKTTVRPVRTVRGERTGRGGCTLLSGGASIASGYTPDARLLGGEAPGPPSSP